MAILINKGDKSNLPKVSLVRKGQFPYSEQALAYGTKLVGCFPPKKGGEQLT